MNFSNISEKFTTSLQQLLILLALVLLRLLRKNIGQEFLIKSIFYTLVLLNIHSNKQQIKPVICQRNHITQPIGQKGTLSIQSYLKTTLKIVERSSSIEV